MSAGEADRERLFNFQTISIYPWLEHGQSSSREVPHCSRLLFSSRWTPRAECLAAINRNGRALGILWCRFADVDSPRERKSPFVPRDDDNYSCKRAVRVVGLRARPLQTVREYGVLRKQWVAAKEMARRERETLEEVTDTVNAHDWLWRLSGVTGDANKRRIN